MTVKVKGYDVLNNSDILYNKAFPRSNGYDSMWIFDNQMGPNPLWLTEFLVQSMDLQPGMRVLDLGCGRGITSVFLAKEYGVQVYAVDLWENADLKWKNAKEQHVEHLIVPLHGDALNLPFAKDFFDVIICVDSYIYFGAGDDSLGKILRFLRPKGKIGIIMPGYMDDVANGVPDYLIKFLGDQLWTWKTLPWWKTLLEKDGIVTVDMADTMPNGCSYWLQWNEALHAVGKNRHPEEIDIYRNDNGKYMGFIRMIGTKV